MAPLEFLSRLRVARGETADSNAVRPDMRPVLPVALIQGIVDERLADGRWRILAGGLAYAMRLPPGARAGEHVAVEPNAQELPKALAPASASASVHASVSTTGRLVAGLVDAAGGGARAAEVTGAQRPLVGHAAELPQLATALRDSIAGSGLFYEAHLAQWLAGERPQAWLRREPQARWTRSAAEGGRPPIAGTPDAPETPTVSTRQLADATTEATGRSQARASGAEGLPSALREMVAQQLHVLEANALVWRGPVWVDQNMEWEIRRDASHEDFAAATAAWRTSVRLDLPHLGPVTAFLSWTHGRLDLRVTVDPEQHAVLAEALPDLRLGLNAAGVVVGPLSVDVHET